MSWWTRTLGAFGLARRDAAADGLAGSGFSNRRTGSARVDPDTALRHSAVWACLRLRADLISTMPVDVYREIDGRLVEVTKPGWLSTPYPGVDITEWLWATQFDLDRYGNAFGLITAKDAQGRPAQIEHLAAGNVGVITQGRRIVGYRVDGERLDPTLIWHERQYTAAGSPLGLSPIAHAAMSIGGYLSAQQFALDWYATGAQPAGHLKNTRQPVTSQMAQELKARFKASVENRDIFVSGNEYEWTPANGDANSAAFLDEMRYGVADVCRFLGVPGDMVDAESSTGSITYANVTQRNLQLLVVNLGPAIVRRERALSSAIANPRIVKLNTDAVLRMDPLTRTQVLAAQVASRAITPTEWRALDNRAPYTDSDLAEFDRLFGAPRSADPAPAVARGWAPPDTTVIQGYAIDLPRERAAITGRPSEGARA